MVNIIYSDVDCFFRGDIGEKIFDVKWGYNLVDFKVCKIWRNSCLDLLGM